MTNREARQQCIQTIMDDLARYNRARRPDKDAPAFTTDDVQDLVDEIRALRKDNGANVRTLLRRIIELEGAARPLVEMLDAGRVSLYGAADAFREQAGRLQEVLKS